MILPKEPPENPFIPCSPDIVEIVKEERSSPHRDDNSEVKLENPELNSPEPSASTKMPEEPSASTKMPEDTDQLNEAGDDLNKDVSTPSDRESKLLQQVEDLSRDLEEMKSMVMRKKKNTLVAKLKKKFQNCPKIKIGIKKRKQQKVQKEPKGSQESNAKTSELVTSTTNIDKGSNEEEDPKEKNENIVAKPQKKQDDTQDMKTQQKQV